MSILDTDTTLPQSAEAPKQDRLSWLRSPAFRVGLMLIFLALVLIVPESGLTNTVGGRVQTFVTIFLGIFIEAVPFLIAGSIVSGFISIFVTRETLYQYVPHNPIMAALFGGSLGMVFPVCECGVVPVTRRLYQKGLPISVGIAFLLAAPVVNPVVVASTYAAFGWGPMLYARLGFSFLIASIVGLIFYFADPKNILLPDSEMEHVHDHYQPDASFMERVRLSLGTAGDDFIDMSRYLIIGSMLAAGMQTIVPQPMLLALGEGSFTSIIAMMALAFVLSVCSTIDAFLALAFVNTFPPAAIMAFLVFGPMVDIKSALMFLGVFKRRTVAYLILLPMMLTLVTALYLNLNVSW